ncbi:AMP-binding protein, partial [Nonomuraea sp. K271]
MGTPAEWWPIRSFAGWVARRPDSVAVADRDGSLTYAELDADSDRLAWFLAGQGIGPEDLIGLWLERSVDFVVAVLAVLKAGAAYVPLDVAHPPARLRAMAERSGLSLLLSHNAGQDVPDWADHVVPLETVLTGRRPGGRIGPPPCAARPDDLAYVIHTSGSTGMPKGVMVTRGVLGNMLRHHCARSLPHLRTTLQYAPTVFDVSIQEILGTLATGGRLVVVPEETRRDVRALLDLVRRERAEQWFMPAGVLEWVLDGLRADERAAASLREIVLAGEQLKITDRLRELAARHGWVLRNQYGPSETHVVTEHILDGHPARWPALPPIGEPFPDVEVRVVGVGGVE